MSYKCITSKTSAQYQLIHSDKIEFGNNGLLYSGEYIGMALGSRYGCVGDKFIITLSSGNKIKAIKVDEKADKDTINGCHHKSDGSQIEMVIDVDKARNYYPNAIINGDFNCYEEFCGQIVKIVKVVEA